MTKRIIVNVIPEETRMALAEDGTLLEVAVERTESDCMVGNIYKGRVENVLPGMQAAFINIGIGKNAFLYAGDIFPHKSFQRLVEEDNLTVGAEIMIEIVKDAMGTKGPRATTHFSIPGRYVVVMPSVDYVGVSRRIESGEERARLRGLAGKIRPKGMGVIVRTVAEGHSEEELARDFQYLSNLWGALTIKAKRAKAPFLLYRDADLVVRIIRDHVKDDIDEVIIDNAEAHARMVELAKFISPDLVKKIHLYKAKTEIFTHYAIEDEWSRLADRRVDLKCGGYLVIDKTEALTVIDVNTGRFIGHSNLADTVFRTNMEAAAEIARQLRLRDIGGIIVADFIDMQKDAHKKAVLAELEDRFKADNTKTNVLGLTELGLVEMTRKKARQTYEGTLYEGCPCCGGRGIIQSPDTLAITIRRQLRRIASKRPGADLVVQMHPRIAERFGDKKTVAALEQELGIDLTVEAIEGMQPEVYAIFEGDKALVRSNEPKKARKQAPRRGQENGDGTDAELEPLTEEELAPLLAEKFAMEAVFEPVSTFEERLAAMTGSLWEPLVEMDDEDTLAQLPAVEKLEDVGEGIEAKKPRRRRRSKKMAPPGAEELLPGKYEPVDISQEPVVEIIEETTTEEAPVKKSRRRRRTKKATDETVELLQEVEKPSAGDRPQVDESTSESDLSETIETSADAIVTKTKRKRRRKKKTAAVEEAPLESMDAPVNETVQASEEKETLDIPQEDADQAVKKTKRRRRRKKKPVLGTETAELVEEVPAAAEEMPDVTERFDETEVPVKKSRRRRRKKKPETKESVENGDEFEVVPDTTPEPVESDAPVVKKKRRRRRSNTKKKLTEGDALPDTTSTEPD
ncbi:MAG TPA: Rne/Rng family ribonuclease [Negativicutes bacterium]|nr:Rne/Rng family ribonuclease [Negativicutes bacterium]